MAKVGERVKINVQEAYDLLKKRGKRFSSEIVAQNKAMLLSLAEASSSNEEEVEKAKEVVSIIYDDMTSELDELQSVIDRYEALLDTKLDFYKAQVDINLSDMGSYEFSKNYYNAAFFKAVPLSDNGKLELAKYLQSAFKKLLPIGSNAFLNDIMTNGIQVIEDYED